MKNWVMFSFGGAVLVLLAYFAVLAPIQAENAVSELSQVADESALRELGGLKQSLGYDATWMKQAEDPTKALFSYQIEEKWLNSKNVLFVGVIEDIELHDDNSYVLTMRQDLFEELALSPIDFRMKAIAPKATLEAFLSKNNASRLSDLMIDRVAVVADVWKTETGRDKAYSKDVGQYEERTLTAHAKLNALVNVGATDLSSILSI